jgi:cytochrome c biogenesis protein CcdA
MMVLVITVGFAKMNVVRSMTMNTQSIKRLGGSVLIIVGVWLIVLSVWADSFSRILFP